MFCNYRISGLMNQTFFVFLHNLYSSLSPVTIAKYQEVVYFHYSEEELRNIAKTLISNTVKEKNKRSLSCNQH